MCILPLPIRWIDYLGRCARRRGTRVHRRPFGARGRRVAANARSVAKVVGRRVPAIDVWRAARGRIMPPVDAAALLGRLLPRFGETAQDQVLGVLRLLLPLTGRMPPDTS